MSESQIPKRKYIVAAKVETAPELRTLLTDALSIYQSEIIKFKTKVNSGRNLDLSEARVLQGYVKSLVEAAREMRERDDDENKSNSKMSDEELLESTKVAVAALEARIATKNQSGGSSES
jgi:hypothetical protein